MRLRIKEIARSKGIQLKDVAEKMNVAQESLTRAIKGNPQLKTLESIAEALEVDITELFTTPKQSVKGYLEVDGIIYKIENKNQLENIIKKID
jgi:transcriptional regulator with XRE-family HTH domain